MKLLYTTPILTDFGTKELAIYSGDIIDFDQDIDILTTSAFVGSYAPTPDTIFNALNEMEISVDKLSKQPAFDLRQSCYTWLSKNIQNPKSKIHHIGCIELVDGRSRIASPLEIEQTMLNSIRSYFLMLDIANVYGMKMTTVALPLLGSGSQKIDAKLMIIPLLNECIVFPKRNEATKRIIFIEKNERKAKLISDYIQKSYNLLMQKNKMMTFENENSNKKTARAFISYSSCDKNIADNLCSKLEQKGIQVWYEPRDTQGPYAEAITKAIEASTHFIIILSQNSMQAQHVLNEIDLAFQKLPNNIKFKPLRIDESIFTPSFKYYLSRQHWMDAIIPPLEERLNNFVENILMDI